MSFCVPKHIACLGDTAYTPNFINGPTPCTLLSVNETKSRLSIDTLFRSRNVGYEVNNITIACQWLNSIGGPASIGSPIVASDVAQVKLTVTYGAYTQDYLANQSYDSGTGTWSSAIPNLRSQINGDVNSVIDMPTSDNGLVTDGDYLTSFSTTNMVGGTGAPLDPDAAGIRTGPILALVYISSSEINTTDGTLAPLHETRYYNGQCWKLFDPTANNCATYAGSPPAPVCTGYSLAQECAS